VANRRLKRASRNGQRRTKEQERNFGLGVSATL
jgi:hypothetical protein